MVSYEECGAMLDEIADEMPVELYRELNGGVLLDRGFRMHPCAVNNDLYILGVYVRDSLGKRIVLYYGSFVRVLKDKSKEEYYNHLKKTLRHEVLHHNEYLAGCNDLVLYDDKRIAEYLHSRGYS
ncbi:MAG: metallopeptidase family protein [Eubacteriales bacterium]|nr:metallopeptidase family protein [Eubacteriales bacterium]